MSKYLKPQILTSFKNYTKKQFIADTTAGIIVGIVALPLAIAFAVASGVTPEKGIITAVVAGFLISFLGGSKVQIGGPTGAFIIIVYGIVQNYGMAGLTIATLMAGVMLIIMGFARFGSVIKFIPHPVVVGFTSGIALIIFTTQIKDFFGFNIAEIPAEFFSKWAVYFQNIGSLNYYSLGIGALCILIMMIFPKITHRIPGSIIAIIVATLIVKYFNLPVETIGSKFGEIPSHIPSPKLAGLNLDTIKNLMQPAITIAILAAIESLLSAVVADGMTGGKHRSNMELVAQGVANLITPLFGGIPATGAIARTATNIRNGGRTPVAGIVHSLTLLLIMLFFGSLAKLIPMAALASVLIIVAYNMSEWKTFISILKSPRSDVLVLLTTFFLTVVFDLTIALEIGMVLSVFLFMKRMSEVTNVGIITRELTDDNDDVNDPKGIDKRTIPEGVEVFEINGPFFFGAVEKFVEAIKIIETKPKVIIIRMRNVPAIDSTGIHVLEDTHKNIIKKGSRLILSEVHTQPLLALDKCGFLTVVGTDNMFGTIDESLAKAGELLSVVS